MGEGGRRNHVKSLQSLDGARVMDTEIIPGYMQMSINTQVRVDSAGSVLSLQVTL